MVIAGGLVLYALGFWLPTLLPRIIGVIVALVLLAGCVALIVSSAQHVPSRTHFDIAREAGTATGIFFAIAPVAAIIFLVRQPVTERPIVSRLVYLAVALCASAAAGALGFFAAFPNV